MINKERLSSKIFGIIKGSGYSLIMFDDNGTKIVDPTAASRFYVEDPGFMVTINEPENELQFNKSAPIDLDVTEVLQATLKTLANEFMLNYTVREFGKHITPKDFSFEVKESATERLHGKKKTSYQIYDDVKVIIRHSKEVDEAVRGSRSRNIKSIILKKGAKQSKFPYNNLTGARAMARHMYYGGDYGDAVGESILEASKTMKALKEFLAYSKKSGNQFNESKDYIVYVQEEFHSLKDILGRMAKKSGYTQATEELLSKRTPTSDDNSDVSKMFTKTIIDEPVQNAMDVISPIIRKNQEFLGKVLEQAKSLNIYKECDLSSDTALDYDTHEAKMGNILLSIASNIDIEELKSFLEKVGNRLVRSGTITGTEMAIVKALLSKTDSDTIQSMDVSPDTGTLVESIYNPFNIFLI